MFPGQEKFGEKSFPQWIEQFKPDLVFTHLDIPDVCIYDRR